MKKFLRLLLIISTIIVAGIYAISCFTPYISPVKFWPITFIALGYTILVPVFLLIIIIWLFVKARIGLILLLLFAFGYKNLSATWAIHTNNFSYQKDSAALRILDWNVRYFEDNAVMADTPNSDRRQMIEFIKKVNADVMFFQDYNDFNGSYYVSNLKTLRDTLGYKYCYISKDEHHYYSNFDEIVGCAIYSKIPLADTTRISYQTISEPESIAYADIVFKGKKIRIFTTHLESMSIKPHPNIRAEKGRQEYDTALNYGKKVTKTLKQYDRIHVKQAEFAKKIMDESPYPTIVCGDFNSVPSSYVYYTMKGKRKDAFIQKGFGLGHSYYALSKTLRIDYILVDPVFNVMQVTTPNLYLSDHFPVVADIKLAKP